jgi:REP element-mobilizing transposase RayT
MPSTFTCLLIHVIFGTLGRVPSIRPELQMDLWSYLGGILRDKGAVALAVGGVADHVHLLIGVKPVHRLCDLLRETKGGSSEWIHEKWSCPSFGWQEGYGAFSVSVSAREAVRRYIRHQAEHHRRRTFREEYEDLLRKHNIPFDPDYL